MFLSRLVPHDGSDGSKHLDFIPAINANIFQFSLKRLIMSTTVLSHANDTLGQYVLVLVSPTVQCLRFLKNKGAKTRFWKRSNSVEPGQHVSYLRYSCRFFRGTYLSIRCKPDCVSTMPLTSPGFKAKVASSNSFCISPFPKKPLRTSQLLRAIF